MAAFERILSGIPELDKAIDNIRLGDNVVWRIFSFFTISFGCLKLTENIKIV